MSDAAEPTYPIELNTVEDEQAVRRILEGLNDFNIESMGPVEYSPVSVVVRGHQGEILGGLEGHIYLKCLHVANLWLDERVRRRGLGSKLLALAEAEAVRRGCVLAYLDTFDFQAPDFYPRHGYTVFGELGPYPGGHVRYFFKKVLTPAGEGQAGQ